MGEGRGSILEHWFPNRKRKAIKVMRNEANLPSLSVCCPKSKNSVTANCSKAGMYKT